MKGISQPCQIGQPARTSVGAVLALVRDEPVLDASGEAHEADPHRESVLLLSRTVSGHGVEVERGTMRTWETNPFVKKPAPWRRLARRLRNWFRRGSR